MQTFVSAQNREKSARLGRLQCISFKSPLKAEPYSVFDFVISELWGIYMYNMKALARLDLYIGRFESSLCRDVKHIFV